jgi:hypothetical protein
MTQQPQKTKYRVRNWRQYNQALINRGRITFWFDEETIQKWHTAPQGKRGRPQLYSKEVILCMLLIRQVFHLSLRMLQGLVMSWIETMGLNLKCPHYSLVCLRAKGLSIPLQKFLKKEEQLDIIFDSTGLKVFGEGEWKVRKHGYSKRRTWRKLHVGMCAETGQVVVQAISSNDVSDEEAMIGMMGELEGEKLGDVLGDGAYDTVDCRQVVYDLGGHPIFPPDKNAQLQRKMKVPCLEGRDQAIRRITELGPDGRALWKQEIRYHRRSRVETLMFRAKTIFGDRLKSRRTWAQVTEVAVRMQALNRMTSLGMPECYAVEAHGMEKQVRQRVAFL